MNDRIRDLKSFIEWRKRDIVEFEKELQELLAVQNVMKENMDLKEQMQKIITGKIQIVIEEPKLQ